MRMMTLREIQLGPKQVTLIGNHINARVRSLCVLYNVLKYVKCHINM